MIRKTEDFEISFFERLIKEDPNYVEALIPLAELYTRKGLYDKGLAIDRRLAGLRKNDSTVHYNLACSLALTGGTEEALKALERALELGYSDVDYLKRDPDLKSLWQDPRFQFLISKNAGQR